MILVDTPHGAALFRLVQIKSADDPALTPYEDLSRFVFWYDPDPYGHSAGIKPVYRNALPVSVDQIMPSVIDRSNPPAPYMSRTVSNWLHFIDNVGRSQFREALYCGQRTERENTSQPRWKMCISSLSNTLHSWLAVRHSIWPAIRQSKHSSKIARQNDRAGREEGREHVKVACGQDESSDG